MMGFATWAILEKHIRSLVIHCMPCFNFAKLLQKFLAGLKHSLSGDLTHHAVGIGMGKGAKSICDGLSGRYSHHCVQSTNWPGHDTEFDAVSSVHLFCAPAIKMSTFLLSLCSSFPVSSHHAQLLPLKAGHISTVRCLESEHTLLDPQ